MLKARSLWKSRFLGSGKGQCGLWLSAFTATIASFMTFGCGTDHAVLNITTPSTVVAGSPFSVTVTATIDGHPDTIINSAIHFASSDPSAVLPPNYWFTPADAGSHTWANGFTLKTTGDQKISATIFDAAGINGTANVSVSP